MSLSLPVPLIDSSGGTVSTTLGSGSVGAVGNNNVATLAATVNQIIINVAALEKKIEGGD